MQAAIGVAQLKKSSIFIEKKRKNYDLYKSLLKKDTVNLFKFNDLTKNIPHRNVIFVPCAEKLISHLTKNGVGARTLFMPMHSQPAYNTNQNFPVTEKLFKTGVCLPSAPSLKVKDIKYVCNLINSFYS